MLHGEDLWRLQRERLYYTAELAATINGEMRGELPLRSG
jgi:hypothetical protein